MFKVKESKNLSWEVEVSWSKNAALPIIASNILLDNKIKLINKPQINDVKVLEEIISISKNKNKNELDLTIKEAEKIRSSILLIPWWLLKFWKVKFKSAWWCKIGKRPTSTFDDALEQAGIKIVENWFKSYQIEGKAKKEIILKEFSVTATESLLTYLAFSNINYEVKIKQAAIEPHVINLIEFLRNIWAEINIEFDHTIRIKPWKINIEKDEFKIIWDYIEAWTFFAIWACVENSEITIKWCNTNDLTAVFSIADSIWINYDIIDKETITVNSKNIKNYKSIKLQTCIFPWFPTDLQSIFWVLLTQANWISKIHETLFEWRFTYLAELENLWAKLEILNPHQVIIIGKQDLEWWYVSTTDLRWWWAMLLAWIIAKWTTYIMQEEIILRWYENIDKKLSNLWVNINKI